MFQEKKLSSISVRENSYETSTAVRENPYDAYAASQLSIKLREN